jgi:mRNA interferase HicA
MAGRLPRVTAAEMMRKLARDGWRLSREGARHTILRHPTKPGSVAVPRHPSLLLTPGTTRAILRDAGLTYDELEKL